jgi:hypothetical protein
MRVCDIGPLAWFSDDRASGYSIWYPMRRGVDAISTKATESSA